jgi:hypothetical protein
MYVIVDTAFAGEDNSPPLNTLAKPMCAPKPFTVTVPAAASKEYV